MTLPNFSDFGKPNQPLIVKNYFIISGVDVGLLLVAR
jgi:hypothetical protein